MNEAEELASTASRCIRTTHARGSFYTKALATVSRFLVAAAVATSRSAREELRGDCRRAFKGRAAGAPLGPRGFYCRKYFLRLSASLLARALTCISLSLLAFSLPRGPLALPAGGEPCSRFLRSGLQVCRLLEQLGLSYPG